MSTSGTQIRLGGTRIGIQVGESLEDAAAGLEWVARMNIRAMRGDPQLRGEVMRRVMSPPCAARCYVSRDGLHNDCNCGSGYQWTTDTEAQAMIRENGNLEGCPARDVWNDVRSLLIGHADSGRGPDDPVACDCDCLTPMALGCGAYSAWFDPQRPQIAGFTLGEALLDRERRHAPGIILGAAERNGARFAVGITLPPDVPGKERIGHAYGLVNRVPRGPQPTIKMPYKDGNWWVWDPSAHWGMARPANDYYTLGQYVAFEVRRDALDGLR